MGYRLLLGRDKLLLVSLLALFNSGSTYIRVALRALLEGRSFQWSYYAGLKADGTSPSLISGYGLHGHTEPLLVEAFVVIWLLWLGCRKPDGVFKAAFATWATIKLGMALWLAAGLGDQLRVSMETIGIVNAPMAWFTVPPLALTWLMSAALLARHVTRPGSLPEIRWTRVNTGLLIGGAALLLLSALVLNLGVQHGLGDVVGIAVMYAALLALILGACPWEGRRPGQR